MLRWVNPSNFNHSPRGDLTQLSVLPGTPTNSARPFINADPETLPLFSPQPPSQTLFPPLLISLPPVRLFLNPPFFQAVQTSPVNETAGAPKMVRKGRDKKKEHRMRPIEMEEEEEKNVRKHNSYRNNSFFCIYLQISES